MPWQLDERLVLTAFPEERHFAKHGWPAEKVGMVSLCSRCPAEPVLQRLEWHAHIPIPDGKIRSMPDVLRARDVALSMVRNGFFTLVHCVAGRNRSGLVGALVVRELLSMSGSEAMEYVRLRRPGAIDNLWFEDFLRSLDRP